MQRKLRIIIVDDHQIFLKGLSLMFEKIETAEIVAMAKNGEEFLKRIDDTDIDIALVDVNMPVMNGIEATKKATEQNPSVKVIALSVYDSEEYVTEMIKAGARGYLLKDVSVEEMKTALKAVSEGVIYYSKSLSQAFVDNKVNDEPSKKQKKLTTLQIEILQLICLGLTTAEISSHFKVSPRTIDNHRTKILRKTNTKNTAKLVSYALKHKLVEVNPIIPTINSN